MCPDASTSTGRCTRDPEGQGQIVCPVKHVVGVAESRLRRVLCTCALDPCLVFLHEIDVGARTQASVHSGYVIIVLALILAATVITSA